MMVCEVLLHRIEELGFRSSCELRPALTVGNTPMPVVVHSRGPWANGVLSLERPAEVRRWEGLLHACEDPQ